MLTSISWPESDHWKLCSATRRFCQSVTAGFGGLMALSSSGVSEMISFFFLEGTSYSQRDFCSIQAKRLPSGAQTMEGMWGGGGSVWIVTAFFSAAKAA